MSWGSYAHITWCFKQTHVIFTFWSACHSALADIETNPIRAYFARHIFSKQQSLAKLRQRFELDELMNDILMLRFTSFINNYHQYPSGLENVPLVLQENPVPIRSLCLRLVHDDWNDLRERDALPSRVCWEGCGRAQTECSESTRIGTYPGNTAGVWSCLPLMNWNASNKLCIKLYKQVQHILHGPSSKSSTHHPPYTSYTASDGPHMCLSRTGVFFNFPWRQQFRHQTRGGCCAVLLATPKLGISSWKIWEDMGRWSAQPSGKIWKDLESTKSLSRQMVQMCSAWHIEWWHENQSTQPAGVTDHARPDRAAKAPRHPLHSHRPWWNSISKRSLKDYWKSIWFCNFSGCGSGLLSFSEPCSVPKDLFISHSTGINRNHPESTGIIRICQNVSTGSTLKWPADRPCANEDPASSDCLAWHLTEICDNEVQVRQQFLLGQPV